MAYMKSNLNSRQILPIVFVSGLLIVSLMSNSFTTLAYGQHFFARLMGKNEIPPVNTTATGTANFTLSQDGNSLHYTLGAHDISGVIGGRIHIGTSTEIGPVLLTLLNSVISASNNGISTTGTITSSDIRGNLTGKPIIPHVSMAVGSMRELVSLLNSGSTYINIQTQQHQNGEIRGQIGPAISNILTNLP